MWVGFHFWWCRYVVFSISSMLWIQVSSFLYLVLSFLLYYAHVSCPPPRSVLRDSVARNRVLYNYGQCLSKDPERVKTYPWDPTRSSGVLSLVVPLGSWMLEIDLIFKGSFLRPGIMSAWDVTKTRTIRDIVVFEDPLSQLLTPRRINTMWQPELV